MSKRKPLTVYISKRYLLAFRILMLLIATYFLIDMYEVWIHGIVNQGSVTHIKGDGLGFYSYFLKKVSFTCLFLWLATFGAKDLSSADKDS